jgi:hypothetical protein
MKNYCAGEVYGHTENLLIASIYHFQQLQNAASVVMQGIHQFAKEYQLLLNLKLTLINLEPETISFENMKLIWDRVYEECTKEDVEAYRDALSIKAQSMYGLSEIKEMVDIRCLIIKEHIDAQLHVLAQCSGENERLLSDIKDML